MLISLIFKLTKNDYSQDNHANDIETDNTYPFTVVW